MNPLPNSGACIPVGDGYACTMRWGGCLTAVGYGATRQEACQSAVSLFRAAVALYFGKEARA